MIKKNNLPSLADVVIEHRKIPTNLFDRVTIILEAVNIDRELQKYYKKEKVLMVERATMQLCFLKCCYCSFGMD